MGLTFAPSRIRKWYELTEEVPGGKTIERMQKLARQYGMAMVVPVTRRR